MNAKIPGLLAAAAAVMVAWLLSLTVPGIPLLTAAVAIGIVLAQIPATRRIFDGKLAPGLGFAAKTFMRAGVVLLGLRLSLGDIADLGILAIVAIVVLVLLTFIGTWWLGRLFKLPGDQPLLIAAGFAICGASAIGAVSAVTGSKREEQATPVALVTLCGTLAIVILPLLQMPLGLSNEEFGHWVGAGVHDVGQVVATAQIAGPAALAIAVVVKLTRVLMLAPVVAGVSYGVRRRAAQTPGALSSAAATSTAATSTNRPPLVPLFVWGFIGAVLLNSAIDIPEPLLATADLAQTLLLAAALFGLGTAVRFGTLIRTAGPAAIVGGLAWLLVATLALAAALWT
ncbi:putative sulfate exporter family transporter [Ornithinimicrobium sp. Arc0846-15]|nr:putative sulfate exporter family transporter [Ornithinimicrobium laminariae]